MISLGVFNLLIALAVLLFVFSVVDLTNRVYGNIVAGIFSSVLFAYTSVIANTGIVQDNGTVMADLSLSIILMILWIVATVYVAVIGWEAWQEYQEAKDEV